ncbi:MAG: sulfatase-like hydrolase/transferase [Candidatus Poribacteria bacterium]|nr:sulfatase-like hydrolase/transferase [Candidatus Poribacteria bacterium]
MKPNIILLMSDQQRWDSLGCNGNRFVSTPHLDQLAADGARFENSFTPWPVCTPARATMWTGVYPHQHKVTFNIYDMGNVIEDVSRERRTLFESMKDADYTTAYFGKWHLGDDAPGMFDVWEGFNSLGGHWVDGRRDGIYKPDFQTDQLIEFMEQQTGTGKPFIAVNSYYPPHDPYTAPKQFYEPYRGKGVPFAGYYAAVSALDHNVGRVMEALERLGLRENTIVVYFSDHGDTFRYREGWAYKFVCHEDAIKVPLIVNCPERISAGTVVPSMVGLQDLMPTVLDWAGLDIPDYLHGKSLVPLLSGESVPWREAYYVQNITRHTNVEQRCIRTGEWKLILNERPRTVRRYASSNYLFDLVNDPEEELNLYDTPREDGHNQYGHFPPFTDVITELAQLLRKYAEEIGDAFGCELADNCLTEMRNRG